MIGSINPGLLQFIVIAGTVGMVMGTMLKTAGSIATSINNITSLIGTMNPAMMKTVATIMLVVAALIALGAIIAVIMGRSKDLQSSMTSIGNSISNLQPPKLKEPELPRYAVHGSHASGLDYVPFDGYRAELHKGERVLTKKENEEYSRGNAGKGDIFVFNVDISQVDDLIKYAQMQKRAQQTARAY